MNYYNEWDKGAAAWLRELIKAGLIPNGYVDERSITDVTPSDVEGFTQCHFFAGIGGWSYALQLAGIPASTRLWTGSPPCQPFSVAGKQLGQLDERHLAPTFMRLVDQCRPPVLFGEQVAAAIGKHWLDDLFTELERQGYACGAAVLPAASVGAPHKRDRLFFGASLGNADSKRYDRVNTLLRQTKSGRGSASIFEATRPGEADKLANALCEQWDRGRCIGEAGRAEPANVGSNCRLANTDDTRPQGRQRMPERADQQSVGATGVASSMAHANGEGRRDRGERKGSVDECHRTEKTKWGDSWGCSEGLCTPDSTNPNHSFWSDADWLGCRDGKFRPVEPGTFPLAHGVSARVGRLRGYGNAIVPQVAAAFVKAFTGAIADVRN